MSLYKQIRETIQKQYKTRNDELKVKIIKWRQEPTINRVERPSNLNRARELGYKPKQGVVIVRVKVAKGLSKRRKFAGGRKPSKSGRFYAYHKSLRAIAEERAARKFSSCEALNSYYVGEDGQYAFYETILLDRSHPAILADKMYAGVVNQTSRAFRGLTSAGRKHRGILNKGFGTNQNRPSNRAGARKHFRP